MSNKLDDKTRLMKMAAVMRAARRLRDVTRNLVLEGPEAKAAWEDLDQAITAKDDYLVSGL